MQMVNASFEPVAQLRKLSLLWTDNKDKIRGFLLDDENKNFIKVNLYAKILFLCFNYVFPFLLDLGSSKHSFQNKARKC